MSALGYFVAIVMISLLYGFGSTILTYALNPYGVNSNILNSFSSPSANITNITNNVQSNLQSQMKIPIVGDLSLIFYSGNIMVDMIMNTFLALPEIITIIVNVLINFVVVDAYLGMELKIIILANVTVVYVINIIAFLLQIRSRAMVIQ
jgi:hypothetical protein